MPTTSLTATILPGVTLGDADEISPDVINRAARPTVLLSGVVDGQTISLGADTVGTAELKNSAVTSDKILNGTITAVKLAADVTVTPGAGTVGTTQLAALAVTYAKVSSDIITGAGQAITDPAAADYLLIHDDSATAPKLKRMSPASLMKRFVIDCGTGGVTGATTLADHSLGGTPDTVRLVLVCTTDHAPTGYVKDEELDLTGARIVYGSETYGWPAAVVCTAAKAAVTSGLSNDELSSVRLPNKTSGTMTPIGAPVGNYFKLKAVLTRFVQ